MLYYQCDNSEYSFIQIKYRIKDIEWFKIQSGNVISTVQLQKLYIP